MISERFLGATFSAWGNAGSVSFLVLHLHVMKQ